jgi:hypothetical protein
MEVVVAVEVGPQVQMEEREVPVPELAEPLRQQPEVMQRQIVAEVVVAPLLMLTAETVDPVS